MDHTSTPDSLWDDDEKHHQLCCAKRTVLNDRTNPLPSEALLLFDICCTITPIFFKITFKEKHVLTARNNNKSFLLTLQLMKTAV